MEKTFNELTSDDWIKIAQYISKNDNVYEKITKSIVSSISQSLYEHVVVKKPNSLVYTINDETIWRIRKFSIDKNYPYLKIQNASYISIYKYYLPNETSLSNENIGISIKPYVNDNYNCDKNLLQAHNDIALNITIDFTKCNDEENTDIQSVTMKNYFDYETMNYMRGLIFDKCNDPYDIYTKFENSIAYIYSDLNSTYFNEYNRLYSNLDKYINVVKLYPEDLKTYLSNNFDWTVEFEGDKIVDVHTE